MSANKEKLLLAGASLPITEGVAAALHGGPIGAIVALGVSGLVYALADEVESRGGELPLPRPTRKERQPRQPGQHGRFYKMFNGKSVREAEDDFEGDDPGEDEQEHEDQDDFDAGYWDGETFAFSELLASGWRPSPQQIFLARLDDGSDVFVSVDQLVHIAFAGSTRQGKTSIIRYLLAQLCSVGCICMLLDPHYTPYDIEIDEDWTPFLPYLRFAPAECKDYGKMEHILHYTATTALDMRKQLREQSKPVGKHIFLFIDEYPAIIAERPQVQKYVAKLLREGAKYKIHLAVASQDFQVKTVSPQAGGAIRESYKTVLYVGGDKTTANVLLDTPVSPGVEATLGKGPVMLRCATVKQAALAHTPFTDNQALYDLLGPSTYEPEDDEVETEALGNDEPAFEALDQEPKQVDQGNKKGQQNESKPEPVRVVPVASKKSPKADDLDINVLCAVWNGGINTVLGLEQLFGMTHGEAYKAYKRIKQELQQPVEEQE